MKRKCRMAVLILGFLLLATGCHNADRANATVEGQEVTDTDLAEEKDDNELANANDEVNKENTETDNNGPSADSQKDDANNPLQAHGALFVKGTQLVDKTGKPFQLRGVSTHGLNWFPEYVNADAFASMKNDWKINCVRLAMYTAEGGSYCEGGNKENLKNIVSQGVEYATDLGLYVIIDWHVLHDLDPNKYKADALAFFDEMSAKYADYDNVIYEICNEPNGGTSWDQIKSYANEVIPVIKKNNPDAVIVVGTPNWSQDVDIAAKDPITGYDNIMYTIHFYADTHRDDLRAKMKTALDAGLPVFCTEFGICDASGAGANNMTEGNAWIRAMNDAGVSYCIWNLSNKGETSSLIKSDCQKTSGWTADELSEAGLWYVGVLGADIDKIGMNTPENSSGNLSGQDEKNVDSTADGQNSDNKTANGNEPNTNSKTTNTDKENTDSKTTNPDRKNTDSKTTNTDKKSSDSKTTNGTKQNSNNKASKDVTVTCSNQWSDGKKQFCQYDLTIKNTGKNDITDWSVELDFSCEVTVDQSWNGNFEKSGSGLIVTPADYNRTITAGQSVNAGLIVYADTDPGMPQAVMSKSE